MLNSLLVPMTGLPSDQPALAAALAIADDFDAHVDVLFVRPHPADAVPLLGEGMSGAMIDEIVRAAEAESAALKDAAKRMFDAEVGLAGVMVADQPQPEPRATAAWREVTGRIEEVVIAEAALSDLVVFPHPADDPEHTGGTVLETVLMGAGRPVLVVPRERPAEIGRCVGVAWNGKAEAARAVMASLPFLTCAENVRVLTAETQATPAAAGERLKAYLAWRRIQALVTIIHPGTSAVGQALMGTAKAEGCDLLVLGGYGHSRMRELILGGVTRHVLSHAVLPVLLTH